jgi:hypothetical protein
VATIEVFWGDEPDEQSERNFLAQLKEDLAGRNASATILANFYAYRSSRQIDFLVVTGNHACPVELKNYSGVLVGGTNGLWSTRRSDGTLQIIDRQNPYGQAVLCKMAISDDFQFMADQDSGIPRPPRGRKFYTQLDSVVCIFPRLESGSQVPSDFKAQTLGYAEFLQFLTAEGARPDWQPEHWLSYIRLLGLTNAAGPDVQALAATTAQELASTYWQRFGNFYRQDLHEMVPLPLRYGGQTIAPIELPDLLSAHQHLQLVGPSGSGKSHLAKHTVLGLPDGTWLPLFIEVGIYEGRLSALLNRSVARFVTRSAEDLIRAASINGQRVVLVVDGFNECPQPLRERLVGDLSAFCRRTGAATLITGQASVPVSDALQGALVEADRLDHEGRKAVLTSYGAPEIVDLTEAFSTAYELSIAAECAAELEGPVTRAALFSAFVRKRLGQASSPAELRGTLRRLALVMDDRLSTSLPLDQVWREAERYLTQRSAPMSVIDDLFRTSISTSQQGRFSFTHELLGRYLAAEALTLENQQPSELADQLRTPRHHDLQQLAVELADSVARADELLAGLADARLYLRALRGGTGRAGAAAAGAAAHQLLRAVTEGMADTTFTVQSQFELSATGGYQLSAGDRALLSAIGTLVGYGEFLPEVAALLDATDAACQRTIDAPVEEETKRPAISEVVSAVMVGSSDRLDVAAHIISEAVRPARYYFRSRTAGYEPRISLEALAGLVNGATTRSYARLFLLCELLQQTKDLETVPLAMRVLRLCWDSRAYHLRLDALMMIQSFAAATHGQAVRQEIVDVLDGLDTKNVMLSSQLVETLYSYDLIEPPDDEDSVLARIAAILANPEDEESRSWAYSIVSNQFEDVVAAPYIAAIEKLTDDQRVALFTLAALGSPSYGFWNDWLLRELIKFADPAALPAFEHWVRDLYTENAMTQEVISCYSLAVQGWAQFKHSAPRLVDAETGDRAAWECYGAIIFWLYRPGLTAEEVVERAAPYWQRLQGELRLAAVDPLYWLMHASRIRFDDDTPLIDKILETFPDEVRPIVEGSLEQWNSLTLTSIFRFAVHDHQSYLISMLGAIGNARSVELLRAYVDDPALGSSAIRAIKQLTGERR